MDEPRMPAVIDFGVQQMQHQFARIWRELASGAVVRIIDRRSGRQKAWITSARPPGASSAVMVNVNYAIHHVGELLDAAMLGQVTQVVDQVRDRRMYVHRRMPAALVPVAKILPPVRTGHRAPDGQEIEREVIPA
jgi:hypothetical protein